MKNLLAPNRVAAYTVVLTAAGAFVSSVTGLLPHTWQATAVTIVAVLSHASVAVKFMEGSQRADAHIADALLYHAAKAAPALEAAVPVSPVAPGLAAQHPDEAASPESTPAFDPNLS